MELVSTEMMEAQCDKCGSIHKTDKISDFRDSNTYPPKAHFMCLDCNQMATLVSQTMPKRLFAYLVNKVAQERFGNIDQRTFDNLNKI